MKVEFNLNYRSLLQQKMSLDFSSAAAKAGQGFNANARENSRAGVEGIEALGLYGEKIMLKASATQDAKAPLYTGSGVVETPDSMIMEVPKISPQTAAENILGFVERRIQLEKDQGASEEELNDLMADAREGVEKGYALAKSDLEALGMMSDELQSEIEESYSLVDEGLSELESSLFGNGNNSIKSDEVEVDQTQSIERGKESSPAVGSEYTNLEYRSKVKASSSFELRTQDGDLVEISFSSKRAFAAMVEQSFGDFRFESSVRQVERFNLTIEGELDEGELRAIGDLLSQLSKVSEKFFDGDVLAAFESALSVGFDGSEIAEFSLDLRQSSMERISGSYDRMPSFGSGGDMRYQPLVEQVGNVKLLSEQLAQFEYAAEQIRTMFDEVLSADAAYSGNTDKGLLANIGKFMEYLL